MTVLFYNCSQAGGWGEQGDNSMEAFSSESGKGLKSLYFSGSVIGSEAGQEEEVGNGKDAL